MGWVQYRNSKAHRRTAYKINSDGSRQAFRFSYSEQGGAVNEPDIVTGMEIQQVQLSIETDTDVPFDKDSHIEIDGLQYVVETITMGYKAQDANGRFRKPSAVSKTIILSRRL